MRLTGLVLLILITCNSYGQGIEFFHGTWKEALEEAKKEDKLIFVDTYTTWCGPCKQMAAKVFTQKAAGDYYNANFINMKLDMEKPDGRDFEVTYPVTAYPTLMFINSNGDLVKKSVGGKKLEDLIDLGKAAILGYDKSGEYAELYEGGDRSYKLMLNYVTELNKVSKPSLKISNDYLTSNPDISTAQKAKFLLYAVVDSDSKLFTQLMDNKEEAIAQSSEKMFRDKVSEASLKTVSKAVEYDYEDLLEEAISNYEKAELGDDKKFRQEATMYYYRLTGEYEKWADMSKKYLKKYGKKNPELYKAQVDVIKQEFGYKKESKTYACEICKEIVKKDDSVGNYSEYIKTLIDCKKIDKARDVTKEAIKKSKSREEDTSQYEKILKYLDTIQ